MEWKGLAARLRSVFHTGCALTGAWNGRRVNCPGLLRRPAARPRLCLRRVVSAFPDISSEAAISTDNSFESAIRGGAFSGASLPAAKEVNPSKKTPATVRVVKRPSVQAELPLLCGGYDTTS